MASIKHSTSVIDLTRRWVVDYFNRHDSSVCKEFVTPEYALSIGEYIFAGRDEAWLPAVQKQMTLFPGLGMTVHRVLVGTDQSAVYFTQHGASGGAGGPVACWSGVALYRSNGTMLSGCVAQEDYMTRQRQLKSGTADPIAAPAAAPWDSAALPVDLQAETVVRDWLTQSWPARAPGVLCDDEHITGATPLSFEVTSNEVTTLFSSGAEVAFHVRQTGRYLGGLPGLAVGSHKAVLHCNGIVKVEDGAVVSGRVIRDRAGLRGSLLKS